MASLLDYTKNLKNQGQFFNKLSQKIEKERKHFYPFQESSIIILESTKHHKKTIG